MFEFSEPVSAFAIPILIGVKTGTSSLVLGLGTVAGGILLLSHHKRHLKEVLAQRPEQRIIDFEERKFRRRSIVSTMIASVGLMLASLFWVEDQRVFAVFIMMILGVLIGIIGIAFFDLFSVSLHQIASPDQKAQKALIEEYLRQRELADQKKENAE